MGFPRFSRFLSVAALGGTLSSAAVASADTEVGITAGLHTFSVNNELGVADVEDATSLRNSVLFGLRLGFTFSDVLGVEGELGAIPSETRTGNFEVTTVTYRAHLIGQIGAANPERKLIPFLLLGGGALSVVDSGNEALIGKDTDELFYGGVGFKYRVAGGWGLRFDARAIFPPSSDNEFAALDSELLLSLYRSFGGEKAPVEEAPPPPPPPADSDGDGLTDDVDQCPNEAEDADGFEDDNGCPDLDDDKDGVADTADGCRTEPEDMDGFGDEDGCPEPDNDADGLEDAADKCPDDPEDRDGFADEDGCPDPDNDGDGVLDGADQCPDQLETANGFQDGDGCPDELPKAVKKYTGVIKGITFKSNSDVILRSSNKTLDAAVKILNEYPDLKLEIQGHTDDVADDAYNLDLSQRRAEAVKAYFVGKGIDESRLVATGYGETQPLIAKKTKAARAKNRRVEFKLVSELEPAPAPTEPAPATQPTPETQPTPPSP